MEVQLSRLMIMSSKDSIKIFEKVVRETTERVCVTMQRVSLLRFFLNLFWFFFLFLLVNDFDGEFNLIGFFVRVEFDEGFEETGHACGARFGSVLRFDFLLGF